MGRHPGYQEERQARGRRALLEEGRRPETKRINTPGVQVGVAASALIPNVNSSSRDNQPQQSDMALERQVRAKLAGKRDPQMEKEAQEWIEAILGKKFPGGEQLEDVLKDGQVLCAVMNKLSPGSIPKVNTSGGQFKMMENINTFQKALKEYGVSDVDVFQTVDLWEKKDIAQVVTTLFALGRQTYKHPEWKGPNLGPRPSDECKRDFTEEQLKAGQTIIGLQAGQNKGATQAGQNMGAGRKILLGK